MDRSARGPVEFIICQDARDIHKGMQKVVEALNGGGHKANLKCVDHVDEIIKALDQKRAAAGKDAKIDLPTDIIMDVSGGNGAVGAKKVIQWFEKNYPDAPLPTFNFLSLSLDMAISDARRLRIEDGRVLAGAIDTSELIWTQERLLKGASQYTPATTAFRKLLNTLFDTKLPLDQRKDDYYTKSLADLELLANDGVASEWLRGNLSAEKAIEGTRSFFQDLARALGQGGEKGKGQAQGGLEGLEAGASFYGGAGVPQKGRIVFTAEQARDAFYAKQNPILVMRSYDPSIVPLMASGRIAGVVVVSTYMASHLKLLCDTHNVTGLFGVAPQKQKMRDEFNEEAQPNDPAYFKHGEKVKINGKEIGEGQDILIGLDGNGLVFNPPAALRTERPSVQRIADSDQFRIRTMTRCFDQFFRDNGLPRHGVKVNVDSVGRMTPPVGIGLVRTEQMVATNTNMLNAFKDVLLNNDRQTRDRFFMQTEYEYGSLVRRLENGPVKIRLFDFVHSEILDKEEQKEFLKKYPKLDIHGGDALQTWPDLYRDQVRAVFQAMKNDKTYGQPLEIMMPAVRTEEDTLAIKKIVKEEAAAAKIGAERYSFGVMVETLDACRNIAKIAPHCDFISFGTNDLTQQYTGMSRGDLKAHAKYAKEHGIDPFKVLTPEVLEIVRDTTARGRKARPDLRVDICGAQAADIDTALKLFDAGVDNISVAPTPANMYALPILLSYRRYDALKNQQPKAQPQQNRRAM